MGPDLPTLMLLFDGSNMMSSNHWQELHKQGWAAVKKHAHEMYPIVASKSTHELTHNVPELNDVLEQIATQIGDGARRKDRE